MDRKEFEERYIRARRAVIELDFTHLNDVQRMAAMATQGPLLLLAGAGSGKTTVLINRIANLLKYGSGSDSDYVPDNATADDLLFLEEYISSYISDTQNLNSGAAKTPCLRDRALELCSVAPVDPWRVIAITFTNKAAGEMKERLKKMLGSSADDIWAMTFHSACARILRKDIDRLGYDRSFTIYDTSDTAALMKRILKELDIEERNFPHKTVLNYISRAKDAMISAEKFLASAEAQTDMRRKIIGSAYLEYEKRLKASNALDFDDLILLAVILFNENPDIIEYYRKRFKYVLVDEYQDTNNLQYMFASALAGGHGNICVVGDDDQSIYKFRGATIENILSFEERFKNARVIRLEQNYRSTGFILSAANEVIRNNKGRKGKNLWTENESGEIPELYITADERGEAQFVADTIVAGAAQGRNWRDNAVLYRMNAQSNQFETAFKRGGIPYRIFGGTGFYERAEIKDMLAYLCVIYNPRDDLRLLRIINNPPRGIGDTTVGRLTELAAEKGISIYDAIKASKNNDIFGSSAARLHIFADMIDELCTVSTSIPLDQLYETLLQQTGYIRMLENKGSDENIARIENVRELKTNIIAFMNENGGSLFEFLSETALFTDIDRDDQNSEHVLLMTMHSAKGLEFDTVFIVGAEEGIFPGVRSIGEPGEMEEERRLCYVAMTRAKRRLYFTCTRRRMLFGKTSSSQPSRFIKEISDGNIIVHEPVDIFGGYDFDFSGGFGYYGGRSQPSSGFRANSRNAPSYDADPLYSGYKPSSVKRTVTGHTDRSDLPGELPDLKKDDIIVHKAFGRGVITGSSPAGGDYLLEISFDGAGTKRMLLKSAVRYIEIVKE